MNGQYGTNPRGNPPRRRRPSPEEMRRRQEEERRRREMAKRLEKRRRQEEFRRNMKNTRRAAVCVLYSAAYNLSSRRAYLSDFLPLFPGRSPTQAAKSTTTTGSEGAFHGRWRSDIGRQGLLLLQRPRRTTSDSTRAAARVR